MDRIATLLVVFYWFEDSEKHRYDWQEKKSYNYRFKYITVKLQCNKRVKITVLGA